MFIVSFGVFCATGNQVDSQYTFASYKEAKDFLSISFDGIRKIPSLIFLYGEISQRIGDDVFMLSQYEYCANGLYVFVEHKAAFTI